jgi:dihydroorotase-like cyclic amidohydrolase
LIFCLCISEFLSCEVCGLKHINWQLAGGVTALVDMPLNSFPTTTTKDTLLLKLEAAKGKLFVDVGFWGGLVPENVANLTVMDELLNAGALGLKVIKTYLQK